MAQGSLARIPRHLRGRGAIVLVVAAIALVARLAAPAPPARTAFAVAQMLGGAVGGAVGPDDFVWEERGGFLRDALYGRRVLFLAAKPVQGGVGVAGGTTADLYRARVRLTRTGRPIALSEVRNLTGTPAGDDRGLVARGRRAAFVTAAPGGGVQGITLLDLAGDALDAREPRTRGERILAAIEGWVETGSPGGVARTEISFGEPPPEALVDLAGDRLLMALGAERLPAALDPQRLELNTGGKEAFRPAVQRVQRPARSFVEVAALAARRLLGPGAAQRVEATALEWERRLRPAAPEPDAPYAGAAAGGAAAAAGGAGESWPPAPIAAVRSPALPGEGAWVAIGAEPDGAAGAAGAAPPPEPPFYATFLRPDERLPGARVHLLAIDTRRVELRLQAGYDAPRPTTGPRGSGRLPQAAAAAAAAAAPPAPAPAEEEGGAPAGGAAATPAEATPMREERVVGAIALGADQERGMAIAGRVLVPPRPEAPTVAVDHHGRPLIGAWPHGEAIPDGITALFQGNALSATPGAQGAPGAWDDVLVTERAALCVTASGLLVHAWGRELDAPALARGLAAAGCEASLQIGRRPARLGFALVRRRDGAWAAERLHPAMSLSPEQLVTASPGAFAYLVERDPAPEARPRRAAWVADAGTQPRPAWLPGIHGAEVVNLGARVRLLAFSPERFQLRLRAGRREVSPRNAPELPEALAPEEHARALAAVGLGVGRRRGARGLAIGGAVGLRFRGEGALLAIHERRAEILMPGAAPPAGADAVELPLTADGGKLLPSAREIGAMRRRAAACVLEDGTLVVAATSFDSDEATTEALLDLGCARVVALDRGARRPAFLHRAGAAPEPAPAPAEPQGDAPADDPPAEPPAPEPPAAAALQAGYDDTTLFVLEAPMRGRARVLAP